MAVDFLFSVSLWSIMLQNRHPQRWIQTDWRPVGAALNWLPHSRPSCPSALGWVRSASSNAPLGNSYLKLEDLSFLSAPKPPLWTYTLGNWTPELENDDSSGAFESDASYSSKHHSHIFEITRMSAIMYMQIRIHECIHLWCTSPLGVFSCISKLQKSEAGPRRIFKRRVKILHR